MEEGLSNTEQQCGLYQELDLGTVEERQHSCLNKRTALLRTRPTKDNTVEEMTPCAQCIYGEVRIKWTTSTHSAWYVLNAQALSYIYI